MAGAAFFDLDKTLIEGSSAIHFGRAAYKHGMVSRRRLARDLWANIRFRLSGSTDAGTDELRQRILDSIAGQRVVDLARLGPGRPGRRPAAALPRGARRGVRPPGRGRPAYIVTAASQELADVLAHVLVLDGGIGMRSEVRDGVYTGKPAGPFTYRDGKAVAIRELAESEGIDLDRVVRVLGLRVGPSDDARGRAPGGGEPGPRARARGARRRAGASCASTSSAAA